MPATSCPEPFGKRSWEDVSVVVRSVIHRKWKDVKTEDIQDATQTAMLDLVDYWVNLASSNSDNPDQNFRYAVQRGVWTGMSYLAAVFTEREHNLSLYAVEADDDGCTEYEYIPDQDPGPEETVLNRVQLSELRALLARCPDGELDPWLDDYLSGETEQAVADRLGISQPAVSKRWRSGLRKLRVRMLEPASV